MERQKRSSVCKIKLTRETLRELHAGIPKVVRPFTPNTDPGEVCCTS